MSFNNAAKLFRKSITLGIINTNWSRKSSNTSSFVLSSICRNFLSVIEMGNSEVEIAKLSHTIIGEPEENLERFKEFFDFGASEKNSKENHVSNIQLRTWALLSATAVIIDILPSLLIVSDGGEEDEAPLQKSSKDQLGKVKRSKMVLDMFDQLLQKMGKLKLARGVSALLRSSVCSRHCLDAARMQQLISVAVGLACAPNTGREVFLALRERIQTDLSSRLDNLEIVKLIVQSVSKEKNPERLNVLVPLFGGIRFSLGSISGSSIQIGEKIDRQLARDLASGRGDYIDVKKAKGEEAMILSSVIALFVRIARASQSGQYGFAAVRACIQGIALNASAVNADLAFELEGELLEISRFFLSKKAEDENGVLGAIALGALLNIAKGENDRSEILSSSVITGMELLVPLALERLLSFSAAPSSDDTASFFNPEECIALICKGAIGVSSRFGSERALVSVAQALVSCLCLRFDDKSMLAADLLVNIAARSSLVRSALDPDGVLVEGSCLELHGREVSLFHQLASIGHHVESSLSNKLLGNLSKYCRDLGSTRERAEALLEETAVKDEIIASRKKRKMASFRRHH